MLGRVYTQYHQYFAILQHNLGQFDVINAFDVNNDGAVCTRHYATLEGNFMVFIYLSCWVNYRL